MTDEPREDLPEDLPEDLQDDDATEADVETAEQHPEESSDWDEPVDEPVDEDPAPTPAPEAPAATGHPAVDEVLRSLDALEDAPVDEHVAVFEQAHDNLRRTLQGAGDDPA